MAVDLDYGRRGGSPVSNPRAVLALMGATLATLFCVPTACLLIREVIAPSPQPSGPTAPFSLEAAVLFLGGGAFFVFGLATVLFAWLTTPAYLRSRILRWSMWMMLVTTVAVLSAIVAGLLEPSLRRSERLGMYQRQGTVIAPSLTAPGATVQRHHWTTFTLDVSAASPLQRQSIITAVSEDIPHERGRVMCFGDGTSRSVTKAELDRVLEADDAARGAIGAPSIRHHLRSIQGLRSR